jgi:aminoglycoside phosphotransferase (APT) family kinase protein
MIAPMLEREEIARLHDEENREEFAIRRGLTSMEAEEREMERAMKAFEEDADQAKRLIQAEWRKEHWGHEPERPPSWETSAARRSPPGR